MKAQVVLPHTSGLPEDITVNTFHFRDPAGAFPFAAITGLLDGFYNDDLGGQPSIAARLSSRLSRANGACEVKYYPDAGGSPVRIDTFTLAAFGWVAEGDLPDEVAVCLSYRANYGSAQEVVPNPPAGPEGDLRPRARRRGRIFIGPLRITGPENGWVGENTLNAVVNAGNVLRIDSNAVDAPWSVKSETDGGIHRPVVEVWADNAWDTQRRRGRAATMRVTLPAPLG